MKYKDFRVWCNKRAADGCWGMTTAMFCVWVLGEVERYHSGNEKKFGKRNTKRR